MRLISLLLSLIAGLALTAAAPAQTPKAATRDWRTSAVMLPSGAYAIGNPAAKVKLVEYLSYTCPHCAHFATQSKARLHDEWVRRGVVRIEVRHVVFNALDMAAALTARCGGGRDFAGASHALFAAQASWFNQGRTWLQANGAGMQGQPELAQLKALAQGAGLAQLLQARGLTPAAVDRCFATTVDLARLVAINQAARAEVQGTPSFAINGKPVGGSDWATLEPQLRAAGAR